MCRITSPATLRPEVLNLKNGPNHIGDFGDSSAIALIFCVVYIHVEIALARGMLICVSRLELQVLYPRAAHVSPFSIRERKQD